MVTVSSRGPCVFLYRVLSVGAVLAVECGLERWMYLRLYSIWMKCVSDFLLRWSEGTHLNLFYILQKPCLYLDNPDPDIIMKTHETTRWKWGLGCCFLGLKIH